MAVSESFPPAGSELLLSFRVLGMPKGAGSKDAIPLGRWRDVGGRKRFVPITRDNGVPIVNVVDSSGKDGEAWREEIRAAAAVSLDAAHGLTDGPVAVRVTFAYAGPKGRWGTGRNADVLKASADRYPHAGELSDGTKLARALEDALNGLVWTDDRRVVHLWWTREFIDQLPHDIRERLGDKPGAVVDIYTLPEKVEHSERASGQESLLSIDNAAIISSDGNDSDTEALAV